MGTPSSPRNAARPFDPWQRLASVLALATLGTVGLLLVWDVLPGAFPARAHDLLGALPLALIAVAYVILQAARRGSPLEFLKAALLALAFLFWAANQLLPDLPQATLFNDLAIALFVLDVVLSILGWPPTTDGPSFP